MCIIFEKLFIVVLFAFVAINHCDSKPLDSRDPLEDFKIIKYCNATSTISLRILNTALISKDLPESNLHFQCFLACLYTRYGFMNNAGKFEVSIMQDVLKDAGLDGPFIDLLLDKCTSIIAQDKCQRAFLFTECFWKSFKEVKSRNFLQK